VRIRKDFLPLCLPSLDEEEEDAVLKVLRSGWITSGPETGALEMEFAHFVGASNALAVSSCTAALFMTLRSLGVGPGDEVVVPSITWPATVNVIEMCGATPIFCDVDYATVCASATTILPALTERTKAVMIVHFAGLACDLDPILDLAKKRGIHVVEDAAHAAGAAYKGELIGKPHGTAACFSFHPIKNITTGEGGIVTCRDDDLLERLKIERFHGVRRDAWQRYGDGQIPMYDVEVPALKFNLPDILSAIGRVQLAKLASLAAQRLELASLYLDWLKDVDELDLPQPGQIPDYHAWNLFAVKVKSHSKVGRDETMRQLKLRGIGTGLHFLATHTLSYYREKYAAVLLPVSEEIGRRIFSLPLFPSMTPNDVAYVCESIKECLMGRKK
jgi:UDP-4-amino-4-deoxy-L-arabinose-oxoglutarate aminotransferase